LSWKEYSLQNEIDSDEKPGKILQTRFGQLGWQRGNEMEYEQEA
jgi:hypothetical protein